MKLDGRYGHLFSICIIYMWKSANSHKKPPPLKHILALPTLGQECLHSETELFEKVNFDLGHPVDSICTNSLSFCKSSYVYKLFLFFVKQSMPEQDSISIFILVNQSQFGNSICTKRLLKLKSLCWTNILVNVFLSQQIHAW